MSMVFLAIMSMVFVLSAAPTVFTQDDSSIAQQWIKNVEQSRGKLISPDDFASIAYTPRPAKGSCLVRTKYLSVDPYQRDIVFDRLPYGAPMHGTIIGEVEGCADPACPPCGTMVIPERWTAVLRSTPWRTMQYLPAKILSPLPNVSDALLPAYLGPLDLIGVTAFEGLKYVGKPMPGEVAFVSAAAGAVGTVAVQLLKLRGLKVIASAGSDDELELLSKRLHADAVINYHDGPMLELLPRALRSIGAERHGIDVTFEQVGGETLEAALQNMAMYGRVVICGAISQYQLPFEEQYGVRGIGLGTFVSKRARMEGFVVGQWGLESKVNATNTLATLAAAGKLDPLVTTVEGWDNAPAAFASLFESGKHVGKLVVKVA